MQVDEENWEDSGRGLLASLQREEELFEVEALTEEVSLLQSDLNAERRRNVLNQAKTEKLSLLKDQLRAELVSETTKRKELKTEHGRLEKENEYLSNRVLELEELVKTVSLNINNAAERDVAHTSHRDNGAEGVISHQTQQHDRDIHHYDDDEEQRHHGGGDEEKDADEEVEVEGNRLRERGSSPSPWAQDPSRGQASQGVREEDQGVHNGPHHFQSNKTRSPSESGSQPRNSSNSVGRIKCDTPPQSTAPTTNQSHQQPQTRVPPLPIPGRKSSIHSIISGNATNNNSENQQQDHQHPQSHHQQQHEEEDEEEGIDFELHEGNAQQVEKIEPTSKSSRNGQQQEAEGDNEMSSKLSSSLKDYRYQKVIEELSKELQATRAVLQEVATERAGLRSDLKRAVSTMERLEMEKQQILFSPHTSSRHRSALSAQQDLQNEEGGAATSFTRTRSVSPYTRGGSTRNAGAAGSSGQVSRQHSGLSNATSGNRSSRDTNQSVTARVPTGFKLVPVSRSQSGDNRSDVKSAAVRPLVSQSNSRGTDRSRSSEKQRYGGSAKATEAPGKRKAPNHHHSDPVPSLLGRR